MSRPTQILFLLLFVTLLIGVANFRASRTPRIATALASQTNAVDKPSKEPVRQEVSRHADEPASELPTTTIQLDALTINAELPTTSLEYERGLGGRDKLSPGSGMLFALETPGYYPFWMKNMLFPLDIIWMDEHKKIVDITYNLPPDSFPRTVTPRSPAQYILEVAAGTAHTNKINIGDTATF